MSLYDCKVSYYNEYDEECVSRGIVEAESAKEAVEKIYEKYDYIIEFSVNYVGEDE